METRQYDRRLWLGLGLVLVGLVFLADNFGWIEYSVRRYIFRWEMVLMLLGIIFILGRGRTTTGIILLVLGGVFYLREFLDLNFNFWQIFWPSLLILFGVMIIFRHQLDKDGEYRTILKGENYIDEMAVFGGGDRIVTSQEFKGGKVTAVFGGLNYNMLKAKLAPGKNYLDVLCIFGGMKIVVPEDWDIKIQVLSFFGGFNEKQRYIRPEAGKEKTTQLIIKGTVVFGGGEIKRFLD